MDQEETADQHGSPKELLVVARRGQEAPEQSGDGRDEPGAPDDLSPMTIRRRTGCETTAPDSWVVKPDPVSADRAWKRADSLGIPVTVRATVAMRVISRDRTATSSSRTMAYIVSTDTQRGPGFPSEEVDRQIPQGDVDGETCTRAPAAPRHGPRVDPGVGRRHQPGSATMFTLRASRAGRGRSSRRSRPVAAGPAGTTGRNPSPCRSGSWAASAARRG